MLNELTNVGRYVGARSAYHDEWFTSILPLTDTLDSTEVDPQRLAQEFFQGVDARYEHILADLDVVRSEKLAEIRQKFESSNVVIIHGASGQGKSTLAFRYLHDYVSNDWRFFIDLRLIDDIRQILRVANALSGHAKTIERPCIVYVDVSPSDQDWPELVRALSHLPELRVLVTIREEDWRRATGYRARFESEELELAFDREEADNLYAQLKEPPSRYLAFDEAWSDFGGKGPLLEFVYFLTQNETLKSRIESQIRNLQDRVRERKLNGSELHLLRLVAVASAYEAKLDLRGVVQHLGLDEPTRTIELFTKEYLIRVDESKSTVTGLHSVRSSIMLESLLDDALCNWESVAKECLQLLVEPDLETFLIHAFSRQSEEATALVEKLRNLIPRSWIGVAGILRALLWLGVRDYTEANRDLIDQEFEGRASAAWFLKLDSDLTEIARNAISNIWYNLPDLNGKDRLLEHVETVRAKQTPKDTAFIYAKTWLQHFDPTSTASPRPKDFAGLAQVLFWARHLQIQDFIPSICGELNLEELIEELAVDTLADLVYALHIALGDRFDSEFQEHRARIESRFKRETNTFSLKDDGTTMRAHFIPDFVYLVGQEEHADKDTRSSKLHEETMYRVDLLRKLLPNRQKYGSHGYGHRLGILSPEYDETEKAIDASNFYPQWAQRINVHFRTLGHYPYRPENWDDHAWQILTLRQEILALLTQLQRALSIFFRGSTNVKLLGDLLLTSEWENCRRLTETRPLLPKSTVDEWGFADESLVQSSGGESEDMDVSKLYEQYPALAKHKAYIDLVHTYLSHLSNFLSQGLHVIVLNPNLGRTAAGTEKDLLGLATEKGIKIDQGNLSTFNLHAAFDALAQLQIEFHNRFSQFLPADELDRLEKEEQKLIRELWPVWYQFAFHPRRKEQDASKTFVNERNDALKRVRRQIRRQLKTLKHKGFSVYEARTDLRYEGESIPCILVDINDPTLYWQAIKDTIGALQQALQTDSNKSLRYYAIQFWMKRFAIVPLVRGKALSRSVFVFPTPALQSGSALENWYWYIPQEVSDEHWARLNVSLWDQTHFQPAIGFTEDLVFLSLHASQIGDLCRFSDESDGFDSKVIANFLLAQSENIGRHLQRVSDVGGEMLRRLSGPQIDFEKRPSLGVALNLLIHICQQIQPAENHDGSMKMTVDEIKEWSERLEHIWDHAEQFKLLWMADVLEQHPTES